VAIAVGVAVAVLVGVAVGVMVAVGVGNTGPLKKTLSRAKSEVGPCAFIKLKTMVEIVGPEWSCTPMNSASPFESLFSVRVPKEPPALLKAWICAVNAEGPSAWM
jgi:hypothetical protein